MKSWSVDQIREVAQSHIATMRKGLARADNYQPMILLTLLAAEAEQMMEAMGEMYEAAGGDLSS